MTQRDYPDLGERLIQTTLPNGLPVMVVPRPGFSKKLAYFVTDYGSIHTEFTLDGKGVSSPAGVAHYLEHKLFDLPDRDVSAHFSALGGSVNAFTGYDMTAYYVSCTEHFAENLRLLLEFVSTPYFTPQSVAKEQGIIAQEIDMTADTPDTMVFENLMRGMYRAHPVRVPILGARETIAAITPEVLTRCHRSFYCPANMLLCVAGDVDAEEVVHIAREVLPPEPSAPPERVQAWPEDMTCPESLVTARMEVAMPMFQLGFKAEPPGKGEAAIRQEIVGDLAAEILFGEASELYLQLYEQGLIDSSFGGGFETVEGMAMLTASGDSDDPVAVRDAILAQAKKLAAEGICEADFQRIKRSALGRRIRDLDSFDSTCFRLCAYRLSGYDYFRFPELYRQIQARELTEFITRVAAPERCCISIITPEHQEETV